MHKKNAYIHVRHYQKNNVFKSAPYPIASCNMVLLCALEYIRKNNYGYAADKYPLMTNRTPCDPFLKKL